MIHWEAGLSGFLHRGRVHRAPAPHDHVVRTVAANAQPEARLVLHLRRRHRVFLYGEAVIFGHLVEQRDRLETIAAVEVDVADGLALELFETAFLGADITEDNRQTVP